VSERYTLNGKGIAARNELLQLLGLQPNRRIVSKVAKVVELDRATTTTWILSDPVKSVSMGELRQFFIKLIENIGDQYKRERCDDTGKIVTSDLEKKLKRQYLISHDGLREYLSAYKTGDRSRKDNWELPIDLCDEDPESKVNNNYRKSPTKNLGQNQRLDLVHALSALDYVEQEREFYRILNQSKQCVAFSIAAPCNLTQKWILNRLITMAIYSENDRQLSCSEIRPCIVNLKTSQIRDSFTLFLQHLSDCFSSTPDRVVDDICQIKSDSPLIFIVSEFRGFEDITNKIMSEFWQKIYNNISVISEQTKIIMFWVDECHPCRKNECTANLNLLDKLDKFEKEDVQRWLNQYRKIDCFPKTMTKEKCSKLSWNWKDPWLVLNNICLEFELKNGVTDIEELWKWTL
jgi:hypothetical protein